jgi:hypothetical protein
MCIIYDPRWLSQYSDGLRGGAGVQLPAGERDFSVLQSVQTDSGAHRTSYPVGTQSSFRGDKATGA